MAARKRSKLESGNSPLNHRIVLHLISRKTQIQPLGKTGFFHILILESTKISAKNNRQVFCEI
jgi:hypothetical protein